LLERLPPKLYKYSGLLGPRLEWVQRLICDSILYFARPSSFNDPLDCRVPLRFDGSRLAIERYWLEVLRRRKPGLSARDRKVELRRLVLLSQTPEGQAKITKQLFESIDKHGTACFSTDPASMLMWSYYAEGHSGVAVRFNTALRDLGRLSPVIPIEVKYTNSFPNTSYYSTPDERVLTVLGTKSSAWLHEQEWRLVLEGRTGDVEVPSSLIDGVVLGMRIDPKREEAVRSWVTKRTRPVDLLRVEHRPNSFELEVVPA
jgi:hypothetical protein